MDIDRASVTLFASRMLSKLLGFVSVIYFARVLGASNLGIYFTFHAIVNVISVFSELGIPGAVVKRTSQSDTERQRGAYLSGSVVLSTTIFVAVTILIVLFRSRVLSYTGLTGAAALLVVVLAANNGDRLMISVLRGERRVATTAWVELLGQVARIGVSVVLLLLGFGVFALVYGLVVRHLTQTVVSFGLANTGFAIPSRDDITHLFGFSKYTAGMNVSNLFYNWTDTIVLAALATQSVVGVYEVVWKLSIVTVLGAQVIGIALAPTITRWHEDGAFEKIESAFTSALTFALLFVIPSISGVAVLGEEILRTLYQYQTGATVLIVLVSGQVAQAVKNVTQNTLFGIDQPDKVFWTNVLTVGANVALNIALVPVYGMVGAAVATLITASVAAVSQVMYLRSYISLSVNWRTLGWQVVLALVMGAIIRALADIISPHTEIGLVALVAAGVTIYGVGLLASDDVRQRVFNAELW